MPEYILLLLDYGQKELLLFASFFFLVGSLDDIVFDCFWIVHTLKRRLTVYRRFDRMSSSDLAKPSLDRPMIIFIPVWQEAEVIGKTIRNCLSQWQDQNFRIYIGCYPNDEITIAQVAKAARGSDKVRITFSSSPGPTSKPDCLNHIWSAMRRDEEIEGWQARAIILHDAEDYVHADELRVYNHLIGRADMLQLPVIPRREVKSRWVAGHYVDEFAEMHGKQMVLREALGAPIPSAGVGCAISRAALGRLCRENGGKPFDETSLTEDYELGLKITAKKGHGYFVRIKDDQGALVSTHELFPDTMSAAITQKARWMLGIALAGWDKSGWSKYWIENWMLLRDRKSSFAFIVLSIAYVAIFLTAILATLEFIGLHQPKTMSSTLKIMLGCSFMTLFWRFAMRAFFVQALYGWKEAWLSVPRTFISNIINIAAAHRAMRLYIRSLFGTPPKWEKTRHFLPQDGIVQRLDKGADIMRDDP